MKIGREPRGRTEWSPDPKSGGLPSSSFPKSNFKYSVIKNFGAGDWTRTSILTLRRGARVHLRYAGELIDGRDRTADLLFRREPLFLAELRRSWGIRRESNSRWLVHSQPPEPLGYGSHKIVPTLPSELTRKNR
jgi:hypothetical protein